MKLHGPNLRIGAHGDDVRVLHRELARLGYKNIPAVETHLGVFGPFTFAAVRDFQKKADLKVTGVVDDKTAHAIKEKAEPATGGGNALDSTRVVHGKIRRDDGSPAAALLVRAAHVGAASPLPLGEETTDADGSYTIAYALPAGLSAVQLRIEVIDQQGRQLQASDTISNAGPLEQVDLTVPVAEPQEFRVHGIVRNEFGDAMSGVRVRAFDRDLRTEELLGEAPTTSVGHYEIHYTRAQFRHAEKANADLVMAVLEREDEVYRTPIHFNVPADFELDINLKGVEYKGPSEWDVLNADLVPLLDDVSPLQLREDGQFQDISFLAEETGHDRLTVGTWIACFHLADKTVREKTPLLPEVFFAFLRQGQPSIFYDSLIDDMQHSDRVVLLQDRILRSLSQLTAELQKSVLASALANNLVPARLGPQIPAILDTLASIELRYAAAVPFGGGKGTIGELLALTPAGPEQTKFLSAFTAHEGPLSTFWQKLAADHVFPPEQVQEVKLTFELGALTRNHIPLVRELASGFRKQELKSKRDLAKLGRSGWTRLFAKQGPDGKPIGVPANIDGKTPEEKMEQFAVILDQQFERAYPTTSFAAKLERVELSPVQARSDFVRFVDQNPAFHLDTMRIDSYLDAHKTALDGIDDKEGLVAELKSVQRVFKLQPTFTAVESLLAREIDSAQQIYFMGPGQFASAVQGSGLNALEAKTVYRRAENTYATALALFGDLNASMRGIAPFGVPLGAPDADAQAKIATLPNLQTLFGSLDFCECTYCRSVYSPAAYFVDVMRFLGVRGTNGKGPNAGKSVRDVLLERRPDLGEIELSCENTNTPLPYIDLVNEVLEDVVAPPIAVTLNGAIEADLVAGTIRKTVLDELALHGVRVEADARVYAADSRGQWAVRNGQHAFKIIKSGSKLSLLPTHQTFWSAAELRANPEYANSNAYGKLKGEVFPLTLPFDLAHLQTRTYLAHLGVPHPRLLEIFQKKLADDVTLVPTDIQIDSAWLGLTEIERNIITGSLPGKQPWEFWGLAQTGNDIPNPENPADPTENLEGTWIQVLEHVPVMLHRSGLTYRQLLQLLDLRFVNPDGSLDIRDDADPNAANCDTSKFTILNLTAQALDRMHRFIRLWRKLDCAMWELDIVLPDTNPAPNVVDKKITDAVLQDLSGLIRLRAATGLELRVLNSLYRGIDHDLYVDYADDGAEIQTLYQRLFLNKLVDAVASFPSTPGQLTGTIASKVPGILAAFRVKETDLNLILDDLALGPGDALDIAKLGNIHRIAVLAHMAALTIDEVLRLKRLWARDPFANPAATRKFLELAARVAASDFSVAELDYLLAHRFTPNSGVALQDKTIAAVLQALRDGLQRIRDVVVLKSEETAEAYVKSKLGLLMVLAKDADQTTARSIVDGTWEGTAADRNALIDRFFTGVLDLTVAKTKLAALAGGLTPAAKQEAIDARFAYVQPELQAFLIRTQMESLILQEIPEVLGIDVPSAAALLTTLHLKASTDTLLQSINDGRLVERKADGSYKFALDETSFPAIYKALRLLHKDAVVIGKLGLKASDVRWWLEGTHAADMGWLRAEDFPIDGTGPLDLAKWDAMQQFFTWKDELPKSDRTALEFAANVLDNAKTSAANIAELAQLTAWSVTDINVVAAAFHWIDVPAAFDVVKQELRKSASLVRLADAMRALRRLGVNAARAIAWTRPDPDDGVADSLKQTVKAKYDLPQWQQVIQPIQDVFREQKRQALVSWLVAHPDQSKGQNWTDPNGLYSFFLIDVEMSPVMFTSRLKQAAASAQLFVQRCLLNLEVDILARTEVDPKWKQWKWMKRFRVWEANRKVFLYPENWIEPELRDEKSPFFKELESELLQNDITTETAEAAFLNYLEKLDDVANLEIRAIYDQVISEDESVLHVIGRSRSSQAPHYFYRKRINRGRWTAWEKVGVEINANHLVAGIHNRRLFLLWPQFLEKAAAPTGTPTPNAGSSATIVQPRKYWEIRMFWTELKKGKWTPKVLSDTPTVVWQEDTGGDSPENIEFRTRQEPYIQVRLYLSTNSTSMAPRSERAFDKLGKEVSVHGTSVTEHIISPPGGRYYNNLIRHDSTGQYFYYDVVEETGKPHALTAHENAVSLPVLTQVPVSRTYSVIDSRARSFLGDGSFFVWDPSHTYFVDYTYRTDWSYFSRAWHATRTSSFDFFIHYHPFVELFIKELNIWGIKGLLNRRIQVEPAAIPGSPPPFDFLTYHPATNVVTRPVEKVDFDYMGAYAPYNWELFFHVPFFIANKLAANQRFEEALDWFHYIFDPTSTDTTLADPDTPQQKFWITKPFYETTKADYFKQKIENIMLAIAKGDAAVRAQVDEWRNNPFNPHLIARMRIVAYQKNVLIKYIQTLVAWGDQLFRQDTIETLNEATQLYILADSILGPRPRSVPRRVPNPVKTFYQLQQEGIDEFGNVLKEVENLVPRLGPTGGKLSDAPELPHLDVLYFCIPNNDKLLTLWDTVADRLFKIRHGLNIEGVARQLALFEPPIDPALLVKAAAAGLDIGAVLADMSAPLPLYRFSFMVQRALELCAEVKSLGAAMLATLEKRDAEAFAQLRSSHELLMLDQVRLVKARQIDEATRMLESLQESRKLAELKSAYYTKLVNDGWSGAEKAAFGLYTASAALNAAVAAGYILSGGLKLIPSFLAGAAGFGGSPTVNATMGGQTIGNSAEMAVKTLETIGTALDKSASLVATGATYERRSQEWTFQRDLANTELPQIDKQIAAADIRRQVAEQELTNHDRQTENARSEDEFQHSKFTNQELYNWMVGQLSTLYFQSYQLAYDVARRAERCLRYELGLTDTSYIQFGYWDSLRQGLLSGEKLFYDIKRLEAAYHEQNRREYELTKHVSLALLDPVALLQLKQNGHCFVNIPEEVFDTDYPGHYFRRLKSVALSIPCTVGPFTTVACTLTLTSNQLRKNSTLLGGKYARDLAGADPRFRDELAAIQSIATSNAQNDHGMFELNFHDDRYLPFEGAGAISSWHIELNREFPQFDYATISDVVMHLSYTAREGGELLRSRAVEDFNKKLNDMALAENRRGLLRVFDLKREYPDRWFKFLNPANPADEQAILLDDLAELLPFFTRGFPTKRARQFEVVAQMKDGDTYQVFLSPLGNTPGDLLPLAPDPTYQGLSRAFKDLTGAEIAFGAWTLKIRKDTAPDFKSLPADGITELFLILHYTIA